MNDWIARLFENPDLLRMGHGQRLADLNLGLGWLYYGLARILRPRIVVVIGSYRGFVPLVFGKAMTDNLEKGTVYFIDPSLVDDFWKDPRQVQDYFAGFGVDNIRHFPKTTQEFITSEDYRLLSMVDMVFVDGYHSAEQARFDFEAFQGRLTSGGIVLFHDSSAVTTSTIYGADRTYRHEVKNFIDTLKTNGRLQVFDLPYARGVTLVRLDSGACA